MSDAHDPDAVEPEAGPAHDAPEAPCVVSALDPDAWDTAIAAARCDPHWHEAVAAMEEACAEAAVPWNRLLSARVAPVLRSALMALRASITFEGAVTLADFGRGDRPHRLLTAVAADADESVRMELTPEAFSGRKLFRYRSGYPAEINIRRGMFRLIGDVEGEERKLVVSVVWDRPVRTQLQHVESMEGLRISPMARLIALVTKERERMTRKRRR